MGEEQRVREGTGKRKSTGRGRRGEGRGERRDEKQSHERSGCGEEREGGESKERGAEPKPPVAYALLPPWQADAGADAGNEAGSRRTECEREETAFILVLAVARAEAAMAIISSM